MELDGSNIYTEFVWVI